MQEYSKQHNAEDISVKEDDVLSLRRLTNNPAAIARNNCFEKVLYFDKEVLTHRKDSPSEIDYNTLNKLSTNKGFTDVVINLMKDNQKYFDQQRDQNEDLRRETLKQWEKFTKINETVHQANEVLNNKELSFEERKKCIDLFDSYITDSDSFYSDQIDNFDKLNYLNEKIYRRHKEIYDVVQPLARANTDTLTSATIQKEKFQQLEELLTEYSVLNQDRKHIIANIEQNNQTPSFDNLIENRYGKTHSENNKAYEAYAELEQTAKTLPCNSKAEVQIVQKMTNSLNRSKQASNATLDWLLAIDQDIKKSKEILQKDKANKRRISESLEDKISSSDKRNDICTLVNIQEAWYLKQSANLQGELKQLSSLENLLYKTSEDISHGRAKSGKDYDEIYKKIEKINTRVSVIQASIRSAIEGKTTISDMYKKSGLNIRVDLPALEKNATSYLKGNSTPYTKDDIKHIEKLQGLAMGKQYPIDSNLKAEFYDVDNIQGMMTDKLRDLEQKEDREKNIVQSSVNKARKFSKSDLVILAGTAGAVVCSTVFLATGAAAVTAGLACVASATAKFGVTAYDKFKERSAQKVSKKNDILIKTMNAIDKEHSSDLAKAIALYKEGKGKKESVVQKGANKGNIDEKSNDNKEYRINTAAEFLEKFLSKKDNQKIFELNNRTRDKYAQELKRIANGDTSLFSKAKDSLKTMDHAGKFLSSRHKKQLIKQEEKSIFSKIKGKIKGIKKKVVDKFFHKAKGEVRSSINLQYFDHDIKEKDFNELNTAVKAQKQTNYMINQSIMKELGMGVESKIDHIARVNATVEVLNDFLDGKISETDIEKEIQAQEHTTISQYKKQTRKRNIISGAFKDSFGSKSKKGADTITEENTINQKDTASRDGIVNVGGITDIDNANHEVHKQNIIHLSQTNHEHLLEHEQEEERKKGEEITR